MPFTQQQVDDIENVIATGVSQTGYDGKTVSFTNLDDLLRRRNIIMRALGTAPAASATVLAAHDRGFPGGLADGDDGSGLEFGF